MRGWSQAGKALLASAFLGLVLVADADARQIGYGDGTGFASASGSVKHPKLLRIQIVSSTQPQSVEVSWAVSCQGRRFRFDSRDGTFTVPTPIVRRLARPLKRPTKCQVRASALQSDFSVPSFLIQIFLQAK